MPEKLKEDQKALEVNAMFKGGTMILSTKEMLVGLEVSNISLYQWIKEGMPVIKQNPYLFNESSLEWVKANKPKFAYLAQIMLNKKEG